MKILAAVIILLGTIARGGEADRLGLAERRAIKQYQEKIYPDLKKKIDESAGFDLAVDVNWESIATPGEADKYEEEGYWTKIYFEPLAAALKSITGDDLGKKALKEKLKKVVIHCDENAPASNYGSALKFDDGALTINWRQYSNAGDVKERVDALRKLLESKL
jgi:hypothetical protein